MEVPATARVCSMYSNLYNQMLRVWLTRKILSMGSRFAIVAELGELLGKAVSSNFWGISCPAHCGPPSSWGLGLSFIAGFSTGIAATSIFFLIIGLWILGLSPVPSCNPRFPGSFTGPVQRLRGYLHEPRARHCLSQ